MLKRRKNIYKLKSHIPTNIHEDLLRNTTANNVVVYAFITCSGKAIKRQSETKNNERNTNEKSTMECKTRRKIHVGTFHHVCTAPKLP